VVGHPNVHPRIHAPGRDRGPFRGPFAAVRPVCPGDPCAVRKVAGRRAEAVDARIRVPRLVSGPPDFGRRAAPLDAGGVDGGAKAPCSPAELR